LSSFTDPLEVRQLPGGERWQILRGFTYWTDCDDALFAPLEMRCATAYTVPAGFTTDFASIPRLLWPLIGHPAGRHAQAAALHDWLARTASEVPRSRADAAFREALGVLGGPAWRRWLMGAGVRINAGWRAVA
jgi:hypothetical protein